MGAFIWHSPTAPGAAALLVDQPRTVGKITQLHPYLFSGRRYGSFAGKAAGGPTPIAGSDSLLMGLVDDRALFATLLRDDSPQLLISEDRTLLAQLQREESLAAVIADISSTLAAFTSNESLTIGIAESAALLIAFSREDAVVVVLSEDRTVAAVLSREDALTLGLIEDRSILAVIAREDLPAIIIVDSSSLDIFEDGGLVAKSSSDALVIGLIDAYVSILVASQRDDTVSLSWQESASLQAILQREDAPRIGIDDSGVIAVTISATGDSLTIGVAELAFPVISVSGADAVALIVSESSQIFAGLTRDDQLPVNLQETTSAFLRVSTDDTITLMLSDVVERILAVLQREDLSAIVTVDASSVRAGITSADAVMIGTLESGSAIEVFLNRIGNVLIATVKHLSPVRRGARSLMRTLRHLGGPRTVEVL
jgi:hypothetical protein